MLFEELRFSRRAIFLDTKILKTIFVQINTSCLSWKV